MSGTRDDIVDAVMGPKDDQDFEVDELDEQVEDEETSTEEIEDEPSNKPEQETPAESETSPEEKKENEDTETKEQGESSDEEIIGEILNEDETSAQQEHTADSGVPLPVFLEEKHARQRAEAELQRQNENRTQQQPTEQRQPQRQQVQQQQAEKKPVCVQDLIDAGELDPDDTPTAEQWAQLEKNRHERDSFEAASRLHNATIQAEEQFRNGIPKEMVDSGLGVEDVVNEETTLNLTGGDWREFSKLPAGSITRAEFLYKKCLERNPQLSTRFSAYKTAHNKTDKPQKTKTEKDEPAKNKPEKEPEITQDDILDEDEQDVKSLLLGDI